MESSSLEKVPVTTEAEGGATSVAHPRRRRPWLWAIGVAGGAVWVVVLAVGMLALWRYASSPGLAATPPELWPAETGVARVPRIATIVMLAHPKCPCTRASIAELGILMTRLAGRAHAHVLFMRPADAGDGWEKTDLWRSAVAIHGVTASTDPGGTQAARFGAMTSGQIVVYDPAGQLVFRGGITAARGHIGENSGVDRVVALLTRGKADKSESDVFGCALADPEAALVRTE